MCEIVYLKLVIYMKKFIYFILIIFGFSFIRISNCYANTADFNDNIVLLDTELAEPSVDRNCNSLGTFKDDLQSIFNAFKIVAPILTLVLSFS